VPAAPAPRWLLLIHQIPPRPSYLRVKVGRRLQALGAVPVKNSVYVLPSGDQALEGLEWLRQEIVAGGGDASVCEARFVLGLSDGAVEALFSSARRADYELLARAARRIQRTAAAPGKWPAHARQRTTMALARIRKRLAEVAAIDFFGASGRETLEAVLSAVETSLRPTPEAAATGPSSLGELRGRTWVTRRGVHVDRIASAWLIRRFIDPEARFEFVRAGERRNRPGDLRFDMFDAEFTHEGELCTFEVLLRRFRIADPALRVIAQIVHDIDLRDARFSRPETPGIDRLIAGIGLRHRDDESRVRDGEAAFQALYESLKRKG